MGVLLFIGVVAGGAAITAAVASVSEYMYIMSEKIHAHLCGGNSPRGRRGSVTTM